MLKHKITEGVPNEDFIRIVRKGLHFKINCKTNIVSFKDKDTGYMISYIPSLELSGYGENKTDANETLNICVDEYFNYLSSLTIKKIHEELAKLGWEQNKLKHKEYSNTLVDLNGNLINFNVEEASVEVKQVEFA